jgi:UDP-sugar transporter A1/2/3
MMQRDKTILATNNNWNVSSTTKGRGVSKSFQFHFKPTTQIATVSLSSSSSSSQYPASNNETPDTLFPLYSRSSRLSTTLLPFSLLSGTTVAVFSAVVRHPTSTLTPLSCVYLLLLAIQYAMQPRLSRRYIPTHSNKQTVTLVEEIAKCSMAAILWTMQDEETRHSSWKTWSFQSSLWMAALPACLYAIQGVLQYTSQVHLDALTFNGLSQTKTLFAALACALVLGQRQSRWQMVGLTGLFVASWLMVTAEHSHGSHSSSNPSVAARMQNQWWSRGVVLCILSAALSGLAGALSQKGLQIAGGVGRNAFLYTMEVSAFSGLVLLINLLCSTTNNQHATEYYPKKQRTRDWFADWKPCMLIPIICKAWTGVLTVLVHKHAGTVAKGFALMLGLVLAAMLQSIFPPSQVHPVDGRDDGNHPIQKNRLRWNQLLSTFIVLVSGWLHFTHPPKKYLGNGSI